MNRYVVNPVDKSIRIFDRSTGKPKGQYKSGTRLHDLMLKIKPLENVVSVKSEDSYTFEIITIGSIKVDQNLKFIKAENGLYYYEYRFRKKPGRKPRKKKSQQKQLIEYLEKVAEKKVEETKEEEKVE